MRKKIICALLLAFFPLSALGWEATITAVKDGDTFTVIESGTGNAATIRLFGVDCPEFAWPGRWESQPYSNAAKKFAAEHLAGAPVTIAPVNTDRYGREVAHVVVLPDGHIIQEELLAVGLAWVDPRFCKNCPRWREIENEARTQRKGLWRDAEAIPPWKWRKGEK